MKKLLSVIIIFLFVMAIPFVTSAASFEEQQQAADFLNGLGLFNGTGTDADGKPVYELDREPTRVEAITMLVRILGKEAEAKNGNWEIPFTDVADWAKPYVGYAYANKLTSGVGDTLFGSNEPVSGAQYATFVLRALGYSSETDFAWDDPWVLADKIGLGQRYNFNDKNFRRGDAAYMSKNALTVFNKISGTTPLQDMIEKGGIKKEDLPGDIVLRYEDVEQINYNGTQYWYGNHYTYWEGEEITVESKEYKFDIYTGDIYGYPYEMFYNIGKATVKDENPYIGEREVVYFKTNEVLCGYDKKETWLDKETLYREISYKMNGKTLPALSVEELKERGYTKGSYGEWQGVRYVIDHIDNSTITLRYNFNDVAKYFGAEITMNYTERDGVPTLKITSASDIIPVEAIINGHFGYISYNDRYCYAGDGRYTSLNFSDTDKAIAKIFVEYDNKSGEVYGDAKWLNKVIVINIDGENARDEKRKVAYLDNNENVCTVVQNRVELEDGKDYIQNTYRMNHKVLEDMSKDELIAKGYKDGDMGEWNGMRFKYCELSDRVFFMYNINDLAKRLNETRTVRVVRNEGEDAYIEIKNN